MTQSSALHQSRQIDHLLLLLFVYVYLSVAMAVVYEPAYGKYSNTHPFRIAAKDIHTDQHYRYRNSSLRRPDEGIVRIIRQNPSRYPNVMGMIVRRQIDLAKPSIPPPPLTASPDPECVPLGLTQVPPQMPLSPATATTKSGIASEVMQRVMAELQAIKLAKYIGKDDMLCNLNGSWASDISGVVLHLTTGASSAVAVDVKALPMTSGFLNANWTIRGEQPMRDGTPFILNGVDLVKKTVAAFTGQCRTCSGTDMITGSWSITRGAVNCHDTALATDHKTDVFRKQPAEKTTSANTTKTN